MVTELLVAIAVFAILAASIDMPHAAVIALIVLAVASVLALLLLLLRNKD